jgi:hypothetical protein
VKVNIRLYARVSYVPCIHNFQLSGDNIYSSGFILLYSDIPGLIPVKSW